MLANLSLERKRQNKTKSKKFTVKSFPFSFSPSFSPLPALLRWVWAVVEGREGGRGSRKEKRGRSCRPPILPGESKNYIFDPKRG